MEQHNLVLKGIGITLEYCFMRVYCCLQKYVKINVHSVDMQFVI